MFFQNKHILVGVTGGIAAYKTCTLVRELVKHEAIPKVVMTAAAQQFVTALTFETLSGNDVSSDQFEHSTIHIDLARTADCIVVCPATANTIGKIATGIADNLLTTLICAATVPVIFCPAMNKEMYNNPIFQDNVRKLKNLGYHFVDPGQGELACGESGWGRLADIEDILLKIRQIASGSEKLKNRKVVVTAGRTEEAIDPVRVFTNHSSGKMGYALAEAAYCHGAEVTLISGPTCGLRVPADIRLRSVHSAEDMFKAVDEEFKTADVLIMAAAVADYAPHKRSTQKLKKSDRSFQIDMRKTTDILYEIGQKKGNKILVGFALETENELENAYQKLQKKNIDFIVLNNPLKRGSDFGSDTNEVTIIDRKNDHEVFPLLSKAQVAEEIINKISAIIEHE